jgi:hypothetical protein
MLMQNRATCDRNVIGWATLNMSLTIRETPADVELRIDIRNVYIDIEFCSIEFHLIVKAKSKVVAVLN